jgi:hypothetical protein
MNSLEIKKIKEAQIQLTKQRNHVQGLTGKAAEKPMSLLECARVLRGSKFIADRVLSKRVESYHHIQYINGRSHAICDYDFFTLKRLGTFGYLSRG